MPNPGLDEHDDAPPPGSVRSGPPVALIAIIAIVVIAFVILHLTGVVGPQSHGR